MLESHGEQGGVGPLGSGRVPEPALAEAAVVVQELREREFGGVLGEAVHHHRLDDAPGEAALGFADVLLEAADHDRAERRLLLRSAHLDAAGEAVGVEQFQQGGEAPGVAVVGGGGEEQPVLEGVPDLAHRPGQLRFDAVAAAAGGSGVVGLVEDEQAAGEAVAEPCPHGLGVGVVHQQVVGDQEAAVGGPGVHAVAAVEPHPGEVVPVEDLEAEAEALLHLRPPLLQHRGGGGNHDGAHLLPQQQFAGDQARLDGLAQPGVVGDEEPDAGHRHRQAKGFHLVGVQADSGAEGAWRSFGSVAVTEFQRRVFT